MSYTWAPHRPTSPGARVSQGTGTDQRDGAAKRRASLPSRSRPRYPETRPNAPLFRANRNQTRRAGPYTKSGNEQLPYRLCRGGNSGQVGHRRIVLLSFLTIGYDHVRRWLRPFPVCLTRPLVLIMRTDEGIFPGFDNRRATCAGRGGGVLELAVTLACQCGLGSVRHIHAPTATGRRRKT